MIQFTSCIVTPDGKLIGDPRIFLQLDYRGKFLCFQSNSEFQAWDFSFVNN